MSLPRVALIGASGYSRVHLEHLIDLHRRGEIVLAGAVVINRAEESAVCWQLEALGCTVLPDWYALAKSLGWLRLDLCIVPTPIHLHARMAAELLNAGVNVLVEKPLAATVGESLWVVESARLAGRVAAVGFQYLHAAEVQELKQRLVNGDIGEVKRISAHVGWPRSHGYYSRNNWAGRLRVNGRWVLDSPVANAMAHFFVLLLHFGGRTREGWARARHLTAELYRAQAIESFDTALVSVATEEGCILDFIGTHSSREIARPTLVVEGTHGRAEWVQDRHARIENAAGGWRMAAEPESGTRERMLRDVLARISGADRFVCRPELAMEHVRYVNALHEHGRIIDVPAAHIETMTRAGETFTYVRGLDAALFRAFREHRGLRPAGMEWAAEPRLIPMDNYDGMDGGETREAAAPTGT